MAFWGCEVKPGKATPFVPPPEASKLHLSQACLSTKAKPGAKAALKVQWLPAACAGQGRLLTGACSHARPAGAACPPRPPALPTPPPPPPPQVRVGEEGPELLVCALREGLSESASLDLLFDE